MEENEASMSNNRNALSKLATTHVHTCRMTNLCMCALSAVFQMLYLMTHSQNYVVVLVSTPDAVKSALICSK